MTEKWFIILCAALLALMPFSAALAEAPEQTELTTLAAFTGLDLFLAEAEGTEETERNPVVSVSYQSNAYAPGPMKRFFTSDPDEIVAFIDALTSAKIAGPGMLLTCFYPHFTLTRADGTQFELSFSHSFLKVNNNYYKLADDTALWTLTTEYTSRYMAALDEAETTAAPPSD